MINILYFMGLLVTFFKYTDAFVAYYVNITEKYYINDNIPKWNIECFVKKTYNGYLCNNTIPKSNCILYVHCDNDECSSNDVEICHEYAIENNIQGIIFKGNPPKKSKCLVPSSFIHTEINNLNYEIEFGYELKTATTISELGIGILVSIFICVLVYSYFKRYLFLNRRRHEQLLNFDENDELNENESDERNEQQSSNSIRILIDNTYKKESMDTINISSCAICLEYFQEGDTISKLNCGHEFKYECIKKWLKKDIRCPLCNSTDVI